MDKYGGRVSRPDSGVWEVFDIEHWTEHHASAIHAHFPSLSVRVTSCRKSLSGFCVVLCQQRASHVWTSVLVCTVMLTVMGALARSFTPYTCVF